MLFLRKADPLLRQLVANAYGADGAELSQSVVDFVNARLGCTRHPTTEHQLQVRLRNTVLGTI